MPDPLDPREPGEPPVLIAAGAEFHGLLALDGPARIEGALRGEIAGPGPLWIGSRANVEARVETDELLVAGSLAGEIRVSRRIALAGTARVRGELHAPSLALADGALVEGHCTTSAHAAAGREAPAAGPDPGPSSS